MTRRPVRRRSAGASSPRASTIRGRRCSGARSDRADSGRPGSRCCRAAAARPGPDPAEPGFLPVDGDQQVAGGINREPDVVGGSRARRARRGTERLVVVRRWQRREAREGLVRPGRRARPVGCEETVDARDDVGHVPARRARVRQAEGELGSRQVDARHGDDGRARERQVVARGPYPQIGVGEAKAQVGHAGARGEIDVGTAVRVGHDGPAAWAGAERRRAGGHGEARSPRSRSSSAGRATAG